MASLTFDHYQIAWVCALPLEAAAASVMLDKIHRSLHPPSTDPNAYVLGELNGHFIAIACLPTGVYGTISAATVMAHMRSTFPRIQFALMVGIGGGVPSTHDDIRLGDVVVSKPGVMHSGVIQYDYGKTVQGGKLEPIGMLNQPPQTLLTHMARLQVLQMIQNDNTIANIVADILARYPDMKERFAPPSQDTDKLFSTSYQHPLGERNCDNCDKERLVARKPRDQAPQIHYGLIASGNQVMKDSETRDRLAQQLGVLCFEMEAAGLMNQLPTLVIRGICDYCDSHKHKGWQGYAALTAAAYTKCLLCSIPASTSPDHSATGIGYWTVPLARNHRFVGRHDEITRLEEIILGKDMPHQIAITGLGGVGKTQVALELAHRVKDRDRACSIFWIPCTSHGVIDQAYMKIAQTMGLHEVRPAEVKEQVKAYLSTNHVGKWLMIFDNADDRDMWLKTDSSHSRLADVLPQSENGRILFTTRNRKFAVEMLSADIISIPDMDKETAYKILERSLVDQSLLRDHEMAMSLLEHLAFLPLAITQASAYINKNGLDLSTYLGLLQEKEPDIVELLSEDFRDPGRYDDIQNPIIITWLISFKQIQRQDQLAADYLSFMACINPRNIPYSLLPASTSKKRQVDALGLLSAYSFTNVHDLDLSLHRLVHIATRTWLRQRSVFTHWVSRTADQIAKVFPNNNDTNREIWRQYLPHALSLVREDDFRQLRKDYANLLEKIATCLYSDGIYQEAELLLTDLVNIRAEKDGPNHPDTLSSMANLASTYRKGGRWTEAETLEVQLLGIYKSMFGIEHPDTLISMANLASTYQNQGRWTEAEALQVQVLEIRKRVLGFQHPKTLISTGNLALTYQNRGQWTKAETLQVQVLEMCKTVFGARHPDTLISMANLASTYWSQKRWAEAEALQVHVLETCKTVLGVEHPNTLISMANLASTYWNQGRWVEAEVLLVQVLKMCKTVLGPVHPDTLASKANLASIYRIQGRLAEAEAL
ncbi:putative kinesin light chain [Aspergillus vadensis CBS 113365]|uniref:Kinesin light chain n=1 Tax=Aspergillus vadensis (strain CBS 113365 / IMI 142717 / IBT 24658) TaxID=1448311 RepID=A0A319AVD7_ASPVC|nr:putative kinesin light chain [Aspergillus vadensis CBS 113365]PYH64327.1 putative kinesin light chain [Aspergillus vadensis CBS 113365]